MKPYRELPKNNSLPSLLVTMKMKRYVIIHKNFKTKYITNELILVTTQITLYISQKHNSVAYLGSRMSDDDQSCE